jgi:hypothetical protein
LKKSQKKKQKIEENVKIKNKNGQVNKKRGTINT